MRRSSVFRASLHRPKTVMGTDPAAFYCIAFLGSFFFSAQVYVGIPLLLPVFYISRLLTNKDPQFMAIFFRYIEEGNAYSAIPRPSDWMNRPKGWGRGLPW